MSESLSPLPPGLEGHSLANLVLKNPTNQAVLKRMAISQYLNTFNDVTECLAVSIVGERYE